MQVSRALYLWKEFVTYILKMLAVLQVDENPESAPFMSDMVWKQENLLMEEAHKRKEEKYQNAFRGIAQSFLETVVWYILCLLVLFFCT